jgi:voltage-gated potassium channel
MDPLQKLRLPLLLILSVIIGGTLGYKILYSVPLVDAFYMTAITVSTVGFREVFPLDQWGKLFTALLIFSGVSGITLTATYLFQFMVEGHLLGLVKRRKMEKTIELAKNHYIICGFGRVGEQIAGDFHASGKPFVVIDHNPEAVERILARGYTYIQGNATRDEVLINGGIERAKGIVAASDSDPDNVLITLSARLLNPHIFIIARAGAKEIIDKLHKAGANRVVSPYLSTGQKMASMMMKPVLHDYLDTMAYGADLEIQLEELELHEGSEVTGKTLKESAIRKMTGATILSIKKADGQLITNPPVSRVLEQGDRLVLVGTTEQLEKAHQKIIPADNHISKASR